MCSGQQTADGSEEESLSIDYVKKSQCNLFKNALPESMTVKYYG